MYIDKESYKKLTTEKEYNSFRLQKVENIEMGTIEGEEGIMSSSHGTPVVLYRLAEPGSFIQFGKRKRRSRRKMYKKSKKSKRKSKKI